MSFTYWFLQVVNLILLVMVGLLFLRLVLTPILSSEAGTIRFVAALTSPVMAPVGVLTPRIVPQLGVILCAILWLMTLRTALFMVALAMGIRL